MVGIDPWAGASNNWKLSIELVKALNVKGIISLYDVVQFNICHKILIMINFQIWSFRIV